MTKLFTELQSRHFRNSQFKQRNGKECTNNMFWIFTYKLYKRVSLDMSSIWSYSWRARALFWTHPYTFIKIVMLVGALLYGNICL